jgi:hypothetical protein
MLFIEKRKQKSSMPRQFRARLKPRPGRARGIRPLRFFAGL